MKELFFKFNTNTDRVSRKPFKYSRSGNIKIAKKFTLLANLILHEQTFALLSYFFNVVTYFVFISFNILIFYVNKWKEDGNNKYFFVAMD